MASARVKGVCQPRLDAGRTSIWTAREKRRESRTKPEEATGARCRRRPRCAPRCRRATSSVFQLFARRWVAMVPVICRPTTWMSKYRESIRRRHETPAAELAELDTAAAARVLPIRVVDERKLSVSYLDLLATRARLEPERIVEAPRPCGGRPAPPATAAAAAAGHAAAAHCCELPAWAPHQHARSHAAAVPDARAAAATHAARAAHRRHELPARPPHQRACGPSALAMSTSAAAERGRPAKLKRPSARCAACRGPSSAGFVKGTTRLCSPF